MAKRKGWRSYTEAQEKAEEKRRTKKAGSIDWFETSKCWENDCNLNALPGFTYCAKHVVQSQVLAQNAVLKRKQNSSD